MEYYDDFLTPKDSIENLPKVTPAKESENATVDEVLAIFEDSLARLKSLAVRKRTRESKDKAAYWYYKGMEDILEQILKSFGEAKNES